MNRKILRLAVPNIISNLSVPLLSSVDTVIMGHLDKVYYLGAIAIGSMIFNFIYLGLNFLRMGTTGLTAQAFGAGTKDEVITILGRSASVAFGLAALLIILQGPIASLAFYLVNATPEVERYAAEYYNIRIFAAPATLLLYAFHGWFLGMQNARYPLYLAVAGNLANLGLNLFFVQGLGMKSDGIALGTLIAQYAGLGYAIFLFYHKYREYIPRLDIKRIYHLAAFKKFFSVNFDIMIRTLVLIFAFNYFTAKSAEFGNTILAANTILLQLWMIMSYGVDGFAFAAESLVGNYLGAGDRSGLKRAIKYIVIWGMGMGVLFSAVYYFFDESILHLFTGKEKVIETALAFFAWTAAAPLINSFCYLWDGIYIGATATKAMRNSMIISLFVFYIPLLFLTIESLGNHALWLAMTGFMFARGLTLTLYFPRAILRKI